MAMMSKALKGALKIGKALTTENNIADGGGLSSLIIRRKVNGAGAALILGGPSLKEALDTTGLNNTNGI